MTIQVVQTLTLGLKVSAENNRFALFETCGRQWKVIDDRTILADVLGKLERYNRTYTCCETVHSKIYVNLFKKMLQIV